MPLTSIALLTITTKSFEKTETNLMGAFMAIKKTEYHDDIATGSKKHDYRSVGKRRRGSNGGN
jgi:hypothetical protein